MNINNNGKDIVDNFKEVLEITKGLRESAYSQLAPVIHAIKTLPEILDELDRKNTASKDIDKVVSLASTLGKDADDFKNEMLEIDGKFNNIDTDKNIKVKRAIRDYTKLLTLSTQYHDVGSRFMGNTERVLSDYTDICEDLLGLNKSTPDEEEVVTDGTE